MGFGGGMSKNVIIFSDGTGQRGGILFDEPRSNIYKLYRASRCGPESSVNPAEQVAFYDPGIGTKPQGKGFFVAAWDRIANTFSQALGLGLTGNIIDCYAALIRLWRPGDKIYLFGFSRGAYTVRCLGGVIGLCGIPTSDNGQPLKVDKASARRIAREAVKKIYKHTHSRSLKSASPMERELLEQRTALAMQFREKYASSGPSGPNVFPHFIGVFDTVASLGNPTAKIILGVSLIVAVAFISKIVDWGLAQYGLGIGWLSGFLILLGIVVGVATAANFISRVKFEFGLPHFKWWRPFHLLDARMKFYDTSLNLNVGYARHALAIDERREAFDRVAWGTPGEWPERPKDDPQWLEQVWFAGCHSDVGGSYPEDEARLSDVSLSWMVDAAVQVGFKFDRSVLQLFPDALGMQHDETRKGPFKYSGKIDRKIDPKAPLHPSVVDRLKATEVLQYDVYTAYRPAALAQHDSYPQKG
jgi:uncharacterized protein (DUF2235 family)